ERAGSAGDIKPLAAGLPALALRDTDQRDAVDLEFLQHVLGLLELPAAAVDEQHVGRRRLAALHTGVAPRERLPERRIVVTRRDAADVDAAVVRFHRAVRPEHDTRRDRLLAAGVADIEALEPARRLVEPERFRECLELRAGIRRGSRPELRTVPGVRHRHLDPPPAIAAEPPLDLDLAAGLLAQHRFERLGV